MPRTKQKNEKKPVETKLLGNFVFVKWADACSRNGWWGGEKPMGLQQITSTGWVVADEKDRISLTSDIDHDSGNICRTMTIPKSGITEVEVLTGRQCTPDFHLVDDNLAQVISSHRK